MMAHQRVVDTVVRVWRANNGRLIQQARLLVDDAGNAAIFTAPENLGDPVGGPIVTGRMVGQFRMRGEIDTPDGVVKVQRRGSSCSWAFAKCRVKTAELVALWPKPDDVIPVETVAHDLAPVAEPAPAEDKEEPKRRPSRARKTPPPETN